MFLGLPDSGSSSQRYGSGSGSFLFFINVLSKLKIMPAKKKIYHKILEKNKNCRLKIMCL
jgi:hypothetical protein